MDGNISTSLGRRILSTCGLMALLFSTGVGHAEPVADTTVAAAEFSEAFDAFVEPAAPQMPAHAVDITSIEPAAPQATELGSGIASYYGRQFQGRPTASGERFDMNAMTAAHRTLPFGSMVRVTNPRNGRSVVVRINDRGPFTGGRTIDLSRGAAEEIGIVAAGHGQVELALMN